MGHRRSSAVQSAGVGHTGHWTTSLCVQVLLNCRILRLLEAKNEIDKIFVEMQQASVEK